MLRSERAFNLAVSIVTAIVLSGASAWALTGGMGGPHGAAHAGSATSTSVPCRPGFGNGDKNHCHSGPPGHTTSTTAASSTSTSTSSTAATTTTTAPSVSSTTTTVPCKPGWGYGDKNHCHSGPPGLGRPGQSGPPSNPGHKSGKKN